MLCGYTFSIVGTVSTEVLLSQNESEKEDRIGQSHSRSENEPYLFWIKFAPGGNRTLDLLLARQSRLLVEYVSSAMVLKRFV
jgi:hypothetical protein